MRGTIPTDNDFSAARPVTDEETPKTITKEQLELARIGNSPEWKILSEYIDGRISVYKNNLFGEDLRAVDTTVIGQRFLAAQSVVAEFQSLKDQVTLQTEIVNEALKDERTQLRQK